MITFGFYDSIKHDRRYNTLQFSALFDGLIHDGVFMSIGDCLQITAQETPSMKVILGSGRAWFDHTWTWNDAPETLTIPESELLLPRIDAIVLEINHDENVRGNSVKVIKGVPSSDPERPTLTNSDLIKQYPLAYISVSEDASSIQQADITNMIGTESTPFVTGILDTIDATMLLAQWEDQWQQFKESTNSEWGTWFTDITTEKKNQINTWFQTIKNTIGEDTAVGLANSIIDLEASTDEKIEGINQQIGGWSIYDSLLTQEEYDDLSEELKNTPKMMFVIKKS